MQCAGQEAYSLDGACTNWAEAYFSRLRRAELGIHHHIAGAYLLRYAQESSWREDNRRVSNGDQVSRVALATKHGKSVDFTAIGSGTFNDPPETQEARNVKMDTRPFAIVMLRLPRRGTG